MPVGWTEGDFLIALTTGPSPRKGFLRNGLGLFCERRQLWNVTHIGSGHAVCRVAAWTKDAVRIATQIADCGDWTFTSLEGWRNQDPGLADRFYDVVFANPRKIIIRKGQPNPAIAAAIAQATEA